jgi:virginiamycin B lyase
LDRRAKLALIASFVILSVVILNNRPTEGTTLAITSNLVSFNPESYQIVQHPLPNGSSEPWALSTDARGRVWVIEQGSNQLGMFNPDTSNFQEYSIPTLNSTADSVMVDSSGNVWLTELTANKLGELRNGSSAIREFDIPNATASLGGTSAPISCGPNGVYKGPNSSIWVLCLFSNQIDQFFTSNDSFKSYNLPLFQSGPAGLVFDHNGNFWFTAADANMLGFANVSELQAGTSDGIQEFAPQNSTYLYSFEHETDLEGSTESIVSSLPTPSGIALSPDGSKLWVTEHVDTSFDSYSIASKSLDRYWTSQTYDDFGYSVSFPNGLAVDGNGDVWIAEHYGNKVAEFNPSSDTLTEYVVPCCGDNPAGVYTLSLGQNRTIWFVEISGNAIGEIEPSNSDNQTFSIGVESDLFSLSASGSTSITIPISLEQSGTTTQNATHINLDISGISSTGALLGADAEYSPSTLELLGSQNDSSSLKLSLAGLKAGIYDLTMGANLEPQNVICSLILKLIVSSSPTSLEQQFLYGGAIGAAASVVVIGTLAIRRRKKSRRKRRSKSSIIHAIS